MHTHTYTLLLRGFYVSPLSHYDILLQLLNSAGMQNLLYVEGWLVKVAVEVLFCMSVYVCLWSGTFQPSLCNLLCLAAQPF